MLKSNCKKFFMLVCSLIMINSAFVYAQENEQNTRSTEDFTVEKGWSFMSVLNLKLSPVIENQPDDGNGGNHFAPIKGINIPVPYGQFVYRHQKRP